MSVYLGSNPVGVVVDGSKGYELIERVYIGFSLTTSEPGDWATNWTDYYVNNGTGQMPEYEHVTGDSAPTWQSGTYYKFTETVPGSGSGSYFTISRNTEPDGTPYSFRGVVLKVSVNAPSAGQFRILCDVGNTRVHNGLMASVGYSETTIDGVIGKTFCRNQYIGNAPTDDRYGITYFDADGRITSYGVYTTIASMVRLETDYYEFYGRR